MWLYLFVGDGLLVELLVVPLALLGVPSLAALLWRLPLLVLISSLVGRSLLPGRPASSASATRLPQPLLEACALSDRPTRAGSEDGKG
jgi:hypothetical protein